MRVQAEVTIGLTRYAESDALVGEALAAARAQLGVSGEVLFVEQADSRAIEDAAAGSGLPLRVLRRKVAGLSQARNLILDEAKSRFVLFLDADAIAEPGWAQALVAVLAQEEVAVAGSRIEPRWPGREPFMARARVVRDQYSVLELGEGTFPYPRVVGAAFGIDTGKVGGMRFDEALGRREGKLFSGEESEFCHRVREAGFGVAYAGAAKVDHVIGRERLALGWVMRRLFYAGRNRAALGGAPAPSRKPGLADWLMLPATLPPYALGWMRGKLGN